MREEYGAGQLRRSDLAADPVTQFESWFAEAREAGIREANAMILSTVGDDDIPSSRTVLLKEVDRGGFTFFTNYESKKGRELERRPVAALLFHWKELERQVKIRGRVEKIDRADSQRYYFSRPYESRIGAWASRQSEEIPDRTSLEQRMQEFRDLYPDTGSDDCVPLPDFWGGYRVLPDSVEFWQGQPARTHDRFLFRRQEEGTWSVARLSP